MCFTQVSSLHCKAWLSWVWSDDQALLQSAESGLHVSHLDVPNVHLKIASWSKAALSTSSPTRAQMLDLDERPNSNPTHVVGNSIALLGNWFALNSTNKSPDSETTRTDDLIELVSIFLQSDIRDYNALYLACEGVDCVYHAASYGMSGTEQLHKELIESVNIGGTRQIIDVCFHWNIPSLIYTSTINVVFGGQQIDQGDEQTVPYVPLHKHVDHYSKTKAIADQMVLAADGTPLEVPGGDTFRTCVLRPPGIYGPQEQRHLARVAVNIERRLFSFTLGNPDAKMNWVHVDNLVQAHILAGEALTAAKGHVASGQVYYINDGEAVNVFDWLTPLFMKLGYKPWLHLPVRLIYMAAILMEYLHMALKLLTRNEVRNIAVTHTFKIDKARKQLGYCPKKYSFSDSVECYIKTRPKQDNSLSLFLKALFILSIIFLLICLSPVPQTQSPSAMQFSKVNQH
ncbi:putative short-chain dehydrogenase/reductase family 42E member 2 [Heterodontus francisci]|uniref:putative short-chain dehydrogenase/reductase family 42E member 2 n=1 Tax=Heterodontus francisci TaxID=7792 RepID=UPI00355AD62D